MFLRELKGEQRERTLVKTKSQELGFGAITPAVEPV